MNWSAVEFDWNQARAFLATALEGSLSAAARQLNQTQPTLSRQVAALERELGVTLFERVGKQLVLTETGQDLMQHVKAMADAASLMALSASGRCAAVTGQIRISAGETIAALLMPPIVDRIRSSYPDLQVDIVADNRVSDLLRREADIAIRHVRPGQADLVARKVKDLTAQLYASDSWLERHGVPRTVDDLAGATFVGGEDNARYVEILAGMGVRVTTDNFKCTTNSHVVGWEMAKQGLGLTATMRSVGDAAPHMRPVLPSLPPIAFPVWLCAHRELHTSRKIRVVYDLLYDALQSW